MNDGTHRALVGNAAFDTFRHQLLGTGRGVLEVTVARTLRLRHGTQRTHATVCLVGATLEQFDLARSLFGTSQHRADHHGGSTSDDGLGQVTGEADTTIGDQRHTGASQRGGYVGHGADLRHANASDDTGGADRTRTDADLDTVCASLDQCQCSRTSGDVAADHLDFREVLLDPAYAVDHALGVAMGGVDDDHVDASGSQSSHAVTGIGASADGSANAQTRLIVLARQRVGLGLFDVLDGHHALEGEGVVDDQHLLDAVLVQQLAHGFLVSAFLDRDQALFRRHHVTYQGIQTVLEAYVARGDDTDQITVGEHRHTGDVVQAGQLEQITHGGVGFDGDRILDHTGLELLDLAHFGSLLLDGHVLVDDADATFLGHGNGQARFGDGIHRSGQQRDVQFDATGQAGLEADVLGQHLGITRDEQDVVESECFLADAQHGRAPERENKKRGIIPSDLISLNAKCIPRQAHLENNKIMILKNACTRVPNEIHPFFTEQPMRCPAAPLPVASHPTAGPGAGATQPGSGRQARSGRRRLPGQARQYGEQIFSGTQG